MAGEVEPKYNVRQVLKPYVDFEDVYQGIPVTVSINLTPNGEPLDPLAGKLGYDPRLPKGIVCPVGARVRLWLPVLFSSPSPGTAFPYIYQITWRLRSLADYLNDRRFPYHQPSTNLGVPNTFFTPPERFPIPAAKSAITYNQLQPTDFDEGVVQRTITEEIAVCGTQVLMFLNPDGGLAGPQQGVEAAAGAPPAIPTEMDPSWLVYDAFTAGDEMILSVRRDDNGGASANWDFSGAAPNPDSAFSAFYGRGATGGPYPDLGAYVMFGTAAS